MKILLVGAVHLFDFAPCKKPAFLGLGSGLWQFSVSKPCSPQPPVARAVSFLD
jgi:hypothetical protein